MHGAGITAMDGWHIALYGFAVYLAVKTLVALMRAYEGEFRRKVAREAAAGRESPAKPAQTGPAG